MDVALYLIAAAILIVLILFAVKLRGHTEDGEMMMTAAHFDS